MTKKTPKKGGLAALVTKAEHVAPAAPEATTTPATTTTEKPTTTRTGPRGGRAGKREDRAISITLKVSPAQYRMLSEARLDDGQTMQGMLEGAVRFYFEKARGTKF